MRDGNFFNSSSGIAKFFSFSLPMRDGNPPNECLTLSPGVRFSLPMRDGNPGAQHFYKCKNKVLAYL